MTGTTSVSRIGAAASMDVEFVKHEDDVFHRLDYLAEVVLDGPEAAGQRVHLRLPGYAGDRSTQKGVWLRRAELDTDVLHDSGDELVAEGGDRFRGYVSRSHPRAARGEDQRQGAGSKTDLSTPAEAGGN